MDIYYLQNSIDSTRRYLRTHRDQAVRFIKANIEGIAYFKKHKKESLEVLRKKLRIQSEQERDLKYLEKSYDLLASKYYKQVPYPAPKAIETVLDFVAAEDSKAKGADRRSFVDETIVREIEASGFIKAFSDRRGNVECARIGFHGMTSFLFSPSFFIFHTSSFLRPLTPIINLPYFRAVLWELGWVPQSRHIFDSFYTCPDWVCQAGRSLGSVILD